jgi:hypothetical protein
MLETIPRPNRIALPHKEHQPLEIRQCRLGMIFMINSDYGRSPIRAARILSDSFSAIGLIFGNLAALGFSSRLARWA